MDAAARFFEKREARPLLIIAVFLPAIFAFGLLYRKAFSLPYQDDYKVILAFAGEYRDSSSWATKALAIATRQNNNYKLAFEHFIVALELEFLGHLNFGVLVALGDLCLLPIAYLLWRTHQGEQRTHRTDGGVNQGLISFLPISLIFFSLTYWETLNWAMAGLQNLPVIMFSLLSIFCLIPVPPGSERRPRVFLACLAAVLATLSSANGFLLAPFGFIALYRRRAFAACGLWCACFLPPLAAYLYHYERPPFLAKWTSAAFYGQKIFYFFAFLGSAVPFARGAALLGCALTIVFGLSIRWRFYQSHPVSFCSTLWIFSTAGLVPWIRSEVASRYSIYSILLLIFAYTFLSHHLPKRLPPISSNHVYLASLVFAVLLCVCADTLAYRWLGRRKQMVLTGIEHYRANPETNSPMIDPAVWKDFPKEAEIERVELTKALRNHLLVLPPR